jgi:hypothetical protein
LFAISAPITIPAPASSAASKRCPRAKPIEKTITGIRFCISIELSAPMRRVPAFHRIIAVSTPASARNASSGATVASSAAVGRRATPNQPSTAVATTRPIEPGISVSTVSLSDDQLPKRSVPIV